MSETVQTILAVFGTVFNMVTTIMFYKTCLGNDNIRVNKILFYIAFILAFGVGLALSQFGYMPGFYIFKSLIISFCLTLLYHSKWTVRIFTTFSIQLIGMISELISYGIIISTMTNTSESGLQDYSLFLAKIITFIIILCLYTMSANIVCCVNVVVCKNKKLYIYTNGKVQFQITKIEIINDVYKLYFDSGVIKVYKKMILMSKQKKTICKIY